MLDQSMQYEGITISCHDNEVPSFVGPEMDRLYGSIFSSLNQFTVYGATVNANTYVVRENGKVISLLLFRKKKGRVQVINEVIKLDETEVGRFVNYIFATFGEVDVILFKAIQTNIHRLEFPHQRINYLEDIVLELPRTTDEYLAKLGKATRKTIKGYMNKLRRDFPSFSYKIYTHDELTELQIRDIINLNRARMAGKHKLSAYGEAETKRIIALAKTCGLVGIATIDGKIHAGAVSYRVGDHYYMSISAHDPAYDDYRLGTLCGFLIISACIAQGGKECHLLWGQHEYKYRFLGVKRDLDNLAVYRSYTHMLRHADMALLALYRGYARRAELWLHDARREGGVPGHVAMTVINFLRSLKRVGQLFGGT